MRNFYGLNVPGYQFRKVQNMHKLAAYLCDKTGCKNAFQYYWNAFRDFDLNRCDLYHFFNALSYGKRPWLVTFETNLPRWGNVRPNKKRTGQRLLASDSCKKILALSKCAKYILESGLQDIPEKDGILSKLVVQHPPQQLYPWDETKWDFSNGIRLVFVGHDFFRKGGREILRAFDRHLKRGSDLRLTIFSKMQYGDYASRATKSDWNEAMAVIAAHPKRVCWRSVAPNSEIMQCIKSSHLGLLPSWGETYGYSVLEAQSCGVPVITTDIRAFPEINNPENGWLISVAKDELGDACLDSDNDRSRCSKTVEDQLEMIITEIVNNPGTLRQRGLRAWNRIGKEHDPVVVSQRLKGFYDLATG